MFNTIEATFEAWRGCSDIARYLVTFFTLSGTSCLTVCLLRFVYQLIKGLRLYVLSQLFTKKDYLKKYGKWALVTGSTDGIGLSMARELARRGHSIIVVGRSEEKLNRTKLSLEEEPNVGEVLTVKIDLSDSSAANYEKIRDQIDPDSRDIGILINNAGIFDSMMAPYHMQSMEIIRKMVNVNVLAALYFTHMILPGMMQRKRGLIVNVSSGVGKVESPYSSVYGHTKTFINNFSRTLQIEYASKPIDIINLTTGPVRTKILTDISNITSFVTTPESYARTSLNAASTLIPSYSGSLPQALILQVALMINACGLIPYFTRLFMKYAVKKTKVFDDVRKKRAD